MKQLDEKKALINNYPEALYATDIAFKKYKRPNEFLEETRI